MFLAEDVHWLLDLTNRINVPIWIDGGWGVDALLEVEPREHADVDIVLETRHSAILITELQHQGFGHHKTDYTTSYHSVWKDIAGRTIDVHLIDFNDQGDGLYGPEGLYYPRESLKGIGKIKGREVPCITPEAQVAFHTGYEHSAKDVRDVIALCTRYSIEIPEQYR